MKCPRCKDFGNDVEMVKQQIPEWDWLLGRTVQVWYWVCPACGHTRKV